MTSICPACRAHSDLQSYCDVCRGKGEVIYRERPDDIIEIHSIGSDGTADETHFTSSRRSSGPYRFSLRSPADRDKIAGLLSRLNPQEIRNALFDPTVHLAIPETELQLILEMVNGLREAHWLPPIESIE